MTHDTAPENKAQTVDFDDVIAVTNDVFWKKAFKTYMIVILGVSVPASLITAFIAESQVMYSPMHTFLEILPQIIGIISILGCMYVTHQVHEDKPAVWSNAFNTSFTSLPNVIITTLVQVLLLIMAYFNMIIPGIMLTVFWAFVMQAIVIRGKWLISAMSYSTSLVQGRWWNVFGILCILLIIQIVCSLLTIVPGIVLPHHWTVNALVAVLGCSVTGYFAVASTILFFMLEETVKKEPM